MSKEIENIDIQTAFTDFNILIVDDEEAYRNFLKTVVEKTFNLNVSTATNPKEAFEYIKNVKVPDLIMLDMQMPVMDGLTALKYLRSGLKTRNIPVIICTALSSESLLIELFKLKISDYLVKPADSKSISKKVFKALKESPKFKHRSSND